MCRTILEALYTKQDTLILMPAGSAKTTWGNTVFLSWVISMFKDVRVGLFSQTAPFADAFSRAIMNTFEENEAHRELFGNLVGTRWTAGEWLRRDSRWSNSKDLTLFAGGTGGQVASKRFDLLLCDDILGLDNTSTLDQREKVKQWFDNPLLRRVVAQGVTIIFGTRWAAGDLYEILMTPVGQVTDDGEPGYGFRTVIMQALIEDEGPDIADYDDDGRARLVRLNGFRSYWEDFWPVRKLLADRARNPAQFDLSMQNDVSGVISGELWQRHWYQYYGTPDGNPYEELPPGRAWTVRMGQDLASSTRERADFTARVTSAEDRDGNFFVMREHRDKIAANHAEYIVAGYEEFPVNAVIVESVQFQSTIIAEIMNDYPRVPIIAHKTDVDKRTRASAVAEKYRMHKVWHHASLRNGLLEREQMGFPKGHDDLVDAEGFSMQLGGGSFFFGKVRAR
jgi:predicted phage terminase large subunit-like protein